MIIFKKRVLILWLALCFSAIGQAQQTTIFTEANHHYKLGQELYQQGVYGMAQGEFKKALDLVRPVQEPEWKFLKTDAELQYAKCAVRLGQPEAEKLVLDFLRENTPSPAASQAALEIGDYYFNEKKFDEALVYYDMAPSGSSSGGVRGELQFKKGYAYFVSKKFPQAKNEFSRIKDQRNNPNFEAANYYYGCCLFFEGKYDEAAKSFKTCESSNLYGKYVPYYITQIYAAQKRYQEVISYVGPKVKDASLRNLAELNQLVGQAYYELGDHKNALPYLEYAANNGAPLRPSDYYQIGYTQYQTGNYKQAIQNFEQLTKQDSVLGQNGLYHLGDSYIRTNNKFAARTAFQQASSMPFDKLIQEEALFNYAKLSYEQKFDNDALTALQSFPTSSKYYDDAQAFMGEIFLNTRDYERAVRTLEGLKSRNQQLNETYQKVTYLRGVQLYQNGQKAEARPYLNKSLQYPLNKEITALAQYWMGDIAHHASEFEYSEQNLTAFLALARSMPNLPEESNMITGNYLQGYNFLKTKNYNKALTHFTSTVDDIKRNSTRIQSQQIKTDILGDAVLRAGDCHFKSKKYDTALKLYDEAVRNKYDGFEYALYQKAIINGLQKEPLEKIIGLERLTKDYPNSRYADEALFQLGITYQEMGKLNEAIAPLRKLVEQHRGKSPLVNQSLLRLGLIAYNQGNNEGAINYYKQVFSNNPDAAEAKDALAALEEIYIKELGKPDEYFAFLETVPGYKVDNAEKDNVSFSSAESQFQQGKYAQAIEGYTSYLAKFGNGQNVVTALYHRAECYASNAVKKYPQAFKDYTAVVNKGQNKHYNKAVEKAALLAYNSEQDFAAAFNLAQKWEQSAETDNARFDAQLLALRSAYRLNNATAVNDYASKVSSNNSASAGQRASAQYYLGKIYYDKGDFAKAYPAFEKVTKLVQSEEMAESYYLMAQILVNQKKYTEAEELINGANKNMAGYDNWIAQNIILLSDIYVAQNDMSSARAALEAVIESAAVTDPKIKETARKKYEKIGGGASSLRPASSTKAGAGLLEMDDRN